MAVRSALSSLLRLRHSVSPVHGPLKPIWSRLSPSARYSYDSEYNPELEWFNKDDERLMFTLEPSDVEEFARNYPGMDHKHWDVLLKKDCIPDRIKKNKQVLPWFYVNYLAEFLGGREKEQLAKDSIYKMYLGTPKYGFGCLLDMDTASRLYYMPELEDIFPDSYRDIKNKDYGGELFVDGKLVESTAERLERLKLCKWDTWV